MFRAHTPTGTFTSKDTMKPIFLIPLAFASLLSACAPATQQSIIQPRATVFTSSGSVSPASGVSGLVHTTLPTTRATCSGTGYGFASKVFVDLKLTANNQDSTAKGVMTINGDTQTLTLTGFVQPKSQGVYFSLTGSSNTVLQLQGTLDQGTFTGNFNGHPTSFVFQLHCS
ncbi:hypothetical protein MF271_23215 (plasmid) [Deinococcus sp. KNUC1210]|uniref:hypothetical protein n=1 Tax=Deinococcus sp. KNUC1210 TaxID=2917691 RepID=UPI001EEFCC2C|nr:hypothetical protein [Deinococcus sp. KNUC1210]ULH17888.1 hypothetical protein MF271_23215 [Deinococcus sp. KNUC1210]